MLRLDPAAKRFERLDPASLGDLGLREREHLQESIRNSPDDFFGEMEEDLLVLGTEVIPSDVVGDRIDILALDADGTSVIIELKRGGNKWQLLQALAYAAMISKWGAGDSYLDNLFKKISPAPQKPSSDFLEVETTELNRSQRVILVAEAYDYEVLVTAKWLNEAYHVDIACYQIALGRDGKADAQYVSCTQIYPPRDLSDLVTPGRRARPGTGAPPKDWKTILSRSATEVAQFFQDRLKLGPRVDTRNNALAYPQTGTIHWYVGPRRTNARVYQVGRFRCGQQDDESFWKTNLSSANIGFRKNGTCLRFDLSTKSDFEFFQKTMDTAAARFSWKSGGVADEDVTEGSGADMTAG